MEIEPGEDGALIRPDQLRDIRAAVDMRQILQSKWQVRANVGLTHCPFHDEKTPSFRANLPGHRFAGRWHCHGCHEKGDVFDFIQRIDSVPLQEAVKRLAAMTGHVMDGFVPESAAERAKRLQSAEEATICEWWYRQQWKRIRNAMNRIMAQPWDSPASVEFRLAEHYGQVLRWIESNRGSEAGRLVFHMAGNQRGRYAAFQREKAASHSRQIAFLESTISVASEPLRDYNYIIRLRSRMR